jgi:hypothetical protein
MSPSSPRAASVSTLIFSGGEVGSDDPYETQICEGERMADLSNMNYDQATGDASDTQVNIYVQLFEGVSCIKITLSSTFKTRTLRHAQDFGRHRGALIRHFRTRLRPEIRQTFTYVYFS